MHSDMLRARIRLFVVAAITAAGFALLPAPAVQAGTADNVWGWAWSGTAGWISMNCTDLGTCATADYGVRLVDATGAPGDANLTGYAWSETLGWICFGTTCTGTTPEGGATYAQYRAVSGGKTAQFWGWAKIVALGADGWIALNCDKDVGADECVASNYHVGFNSATGVFNPGGVTDHWAWSGNSDGTGLGWIDMSGVNTSWVYAKLGVVRRPAGVYEPQSLGGACVTDSNCTTAPHFKCNTGICVLPGTHLSAFPIVFQGLSASTGQLLECEILLPDASRRVINKVLTYPMPPGRVVNGTDSLTYTVQPGDVIQQNTLWYLSVCRLASADTYGTCAADAACLPGGICDETLGECRSVVDSTLRPKPIFAHVNAWTGLGAQEDQYQAIKCSAGFPDNYFKNAAICDFTADASFALSMRRGIPVEGDCGDGADNDGNGQVDCADRYCKGVSYLCPGATLPRTVCTWGQSGDGVNDCSDPAYVYGDLCCTRQPVATGAPLSHITDGLECTLGDPKDGVFDCSCAGAAQFDASPSDDCFAPGYQSGDLCCDASGNVTKQ